MQEKKPLRIYSLVVKNRERERGNQKTVLMRSGLIFPLSVTDNLSLSFHSQVLAWHEDGVRGGGNRGPLYRAWLVGFFCFCCNQLFFSFSFSSQSWVTLSVEQERSFPAYKSLKTVSHMRNACLLPFFFVLPSWHPFPFSDCLSVFSVPTRSLCLFSPLPFWLREPRLTKRMSK
jgi:hypothetical protein